MIQALLRAVVALTAALAGLDCQDAKQEHAEPRTARVIRRDFSSSVLATGAVRPQIGAEVRVGSRLSGRVERLLANIGDRVEKGQVIAELEKKDLMAVVAERRAQLRLAEAQQAAVKSLRPRETEKLQAEVAKWQATADLAARELEREEALLKKELTSQETRDRCKERQAVAQAELAAARKALELIMIQHTEDLRQAAAEIERARAALENVQVELAYATITAPLAGIVASVSTQEGETVAAGLNAPTFLTIIDLDRLQVDAFVDEVDIGKVGKGQAVVFAVDSYPDREFKGQVVAIHPKAVIQENVVTYDVVIAIEGNGEGLLRPEMTAAVTILLDSRPNVLAIPLKAVMREQGRNLASVVGKNGPAPREIKTGWKDGQWVEVVSGLEEGETVLLGTSSPGPNQ